MKKSELIAEIDRVKSMILIMSEMREVIERDYPHLVEDAYKLERLAQRELEYLVGS